MMLKSLSITLYSMGNIRTTLILPDLGKSIILATYFVRHSIIKPISVLKLWCKFVLFAIKFAMSKSEQFKNNLFLDVITLYDKLS